MKIGILTFYSCHNYGAILQTYALQEHLKSKGFKVYIIPYNPPEVIGQYYDIGWISSTGLSFSRRIKRMLGNIYRMIIVFPLKLMRGKWFNRFIHSNFNVCSDYKNFDFSCCVIGSDQIWNKNITKDDYFYFEYLPNVNRISYAASAGNGEDLLLNDSRAIDAINSLDAISVRENSLKAKLEKHIDKDINLVLDPTLLVSAEVFDKIAVEPKFKDKYVLIYRMLPSEKLFSVAKKFAKEHQVALYEVKPYVSLKSLFFPESNKMFESPEKFLGWFKNAEFVVTTSFHGVAFSLVFQKSFYFISSDNPAENRIKSLLEQLGLTDRIISGDTIPVFNHIDYSTVESKLNNLRKESNDFLMNALSNYSI